MCVSMGPAGCQVILSWILVTILFVKTLKTNVNHVDNFDDIIVTT